MPAGVCDFLLWVSGIGMQKMESFPDSELRMSYLLLSPFHLSTQALSEILVIGEEAKFVMKSYANMHY